MRRQEYYYFDFGLGTLIHFLHRSINFLHFLYSFSYFGEGRFPLFPSGGAYVHLWEIQSNTSADLSASASNTFLKVKNL